MKKTYIQPSEKVKQITIKASLMATSGGVSNNSTLGDVYNAADESYTKEEKNTLWEEMW